jgi:hypothetical protein
MPIFEIGKPYPGKLEASQHLTLQSTGYHDRVTRYASCPSWVKLMSPASWSWRNARSLVLRCIPAAGWGWHIETAVHVIRLILGAPKFEQQIEEGRREIEAAEGRSTSAARSVHQVLLCLYLFYFLFN